jgi:hypothetical protein
VAVVTVLRRLVQACVTVVVIVGVGLMAGPWAAAGVMAVVAVVGLIGVLATVEARAFGQDRRSLPAPIVVSERSGPSEVEHLAFARALAVVVASYVAECERQAGLR